MFVYIDPTGVNAFFLFVQKGIFFGTSIILSIETKYLNPKDKRRNISKTKFLSYNVE